MRTLADAQRVPPARFRLSPLESFLIPLISSTSLTSVLHPDRRPTDEARPEPGGAALEACGRSVGKALEA
jgi:hypothetical protein